MAGSEQTSILEQCGEVTSTFYWIDWSKFTDDGTFIVKFSDYTATCHMSGHARIAPNEPDYALWEWLHGRYKSGDLKDTLISDKALQDFRAEFNALSA